MKETLRVLQVEDSESDAALIVRSFVHAGYEVHARRVEDGAGMRAAVESETWDVVLADHHMAQFDAPGALGVLQGSGQDIPFLIVSGSIGEELAVTMMKSGAVDYVNKNDLSRLVPAVARELREAGSRRERHRAERNLRDSEERMALAIQATQLGTFDLSLRTGKLIWSELTRRHFGVRRDAEITYDTFLQGLHPEDRERADERVRNLLLPGSSREYADEYRTIGIDDGTVRWVASWGRVFADTEGQPLRFVGVTLDITERKGLEDQYRQAQKLESIGRLAGGVAHDFNNLLTIINGHSELILDKLDALDPLGASVREIRKAGGRATELTQQLLAFSRKQVVEPKVLNLNRLVSANRDMIGRLIGEDIELVVHLAHNLGNTCVDAGQMHQVLMNLVVNARDAMPSGGQLTIETENFPETVDGPHQGEFVVLRVSDTGIGMDEEIRKHVFEPFFTTKDEGVGTGLGLSTVYGIANQCGGWVDLTTAPGLGARFTIGLPSTTAPPAADQGSGRARPEEGSETVLLVEDQDEVRKLASIVLRAHGYQVLEARNGGEALRIAGRFEGPIELMLTDVVMPGINGKDLADRMLSLRSGLRVLFMSGYTDNVITNRGALGGEMDYIPKPFTPEGLAGKVRALLNSGIGMGV